MNLGFKILEFWTFDQILGLGTEGLPTPAQLQLGEIENAQNIINPFVIYAMIEGLTIVDGSPSKYFFTAKNIRLLNKKYSDRRLFPRNPQSYFSPICWENAIGVYDRETRFGAIELSPLKLLPRNEDSTTKTITLCTNRLIDRVTSVYQS